MRLISVVGILLLSLCLSAQDRFEVGIGAGSTHEMAQDAFKTAASGGDGQLYWLGYGLDKNWAVELGLDQLDFDGLDSKHKAISLSGVYRFTPENWVHPIAKLGVNSVESKSAADVKTGSFGLKAAAGLEADAFKYISIGGLFNFNYISKSDSALDHKDTQAMMVAVFLTIHNALDGADDEPSKSTAPEAAAAPPAKDSDSDGVSDEDDKCPGTPASVAVNKIGCSEKEKASVKLNVVFALGKAELKSDSDSEIRSLAAFMKKFPDAKVEISGHSDSAGAVDFNNALSQKRADTVKDALVKAGVESSRLTAKGYGPSRPVASNKTKEGRDQNRRVTAEISVSVDKQK